MIQSAINSMMSSVGAGIKTAKGIRQDMITGTVKGATSEALGQIASSPLSEAMKKDYSKQLVDLQKLALQRVSNIRQAKQFQRETFMKTTQMLKGDK